MLKIEQRGQLLIIWFIEYDNNQWLNIGGICQVGSYHGRIISFIRSPMPSTCLLDGSRSYWEAVIRYRRRLSFVLSFFFTSIYVTRDFRHFIACFLFQSSDLVPRKHSFELKYKILKSTYKLKYILDWQFQLSIRAIVQDLFV